MDAEMEDGKITSATLSDGRTVQPDEEYQVVMCAPDYDAETYTHMEDTGLVIDGTFLDFLTGKTLTPPEKLCR